MFYAKLATKQIGWLKDDLNFDGFFKQRVMPIKDQLKAATANNQIKSLDDITQILLTKGFYNHLSDKDSFYADPGHLSEAIRILGSSACSMTCQAISTTSQIYDYMQSTAALANFVMGEPTRHYVAHIERATDSGSLSQFCVYIIQREYFSTADLTKLNALLQKTMALDN